MTVKSWTMWSEHRAMMELTLGRPASSHEPTSPPATNEDNNASKIEAYLRLLEEERRKIEAFKRELPICMGLLSSEIEASRTQLCDCKRDDYCCEVDKSASAESITTSSFPLCKADFIVSDILNSIREEPNQCESMSGDEAQPHSYWSRGGKNTTVCQEEVLQMANSLYKTRATGSCEEDSHAYSKTLGTRPGGAFVPFLRDKKRRLTDEAAETTSPPPQTDHEDTCHNPNMSTSTGFTGIEGASYQHFDEPFPSASTLANNGTSNQTSPHRKPRRCWSAELHRKFVNALKQLGGSEVATPKQIREVMQVDGLTNDEVKSHLQKYRLHTKRPNPMSTMHISSATTQTPSGGAAPQLVVLGGIWVPQDFQLKPTLYMNNVPQTIDQALSKQAGRAFVEQNLMSVQAELNIASTQ
ncbi:hypothetical protein GOP47_0003843 [Adiantum capillus-veneris]|uniref:HTH myb-type domain-containing protein n=1 Tax=Adiantum capillus-veneris TaxID=13818 RepID=A0A9D4V722_ADICA|nr:hypothetical protein GOP47_0003843 [Adiantum capillus-veneris]